MIDEKKLKRDDLCDICNSADCANCFSDSDFEKWINAQPKVGEWIPCSERLPEDTSNYLVTVMIGSPFGAYKEVRSAIYNIKTGWYVYKNTDEVVAVIAWKEPSEPWEGAERNDTTRSN